MTKNSHRSTVLGAMPGTQAEIRKRTGLSTAVVSRWVNALRDSGEAHVSAWIAPPPNGGAHAMYYTAGPGVDVEPPGGMFDAERARRKRVQDRASRAPRRDPLMALFGRG